MSDAETRRTRRRRRSDQGIVAQPAAVARPSILFVDDDESRRGVVHRIMIVDSSNNVNRFDFLEQRLNRDVPESVFRWRPPAGTRRIQP